MSGERTMSYRLKAALLCALVGLSGLSAGCELTGLSGASLPFMLGALAASQVQTTTVEYRCFRDGIEVDCSELPSFRP